MARPKNTDKLSSLRTQLSQSRHWRKNVDRDQKWKRMVNLYRGKHLASKQSEDRAVVNIAKSTIDVIGPSVAVSNPRFSLQARKPEDAASAVITEEVLNYVWRTFKYQTQFRLAVLDKLVIGHGWLKVGYKAAKPPKSVIVNPEAQDADGQEGIEDRDADHPGNSESQMNIGWEDDRPYVERVSPWDIFVDPHARHPSNMEWIAQRTRRRVNDIMVDKRYEKKVREKAVGSHHSRYTDENAGDGRADWDRADSNALYADVIEFYDLRRQEVSTFLAEGSPEDGFLIAPKELPYAFGHPFVMIRNYEVLDTFYPMGELESIEALQMELNETRTQLLNHRRKEARKYMVHMDSLDEKARQALLSNVDNQLVPFDGDIDDMGKAVLPLPTTPISGDAYNMTSIVQQDIDRVSGVSDYMRGTAAEIRRTATEAAMIQDAQNARAADKLAQVELALSEVGERLVQLMQQFMTGEHVIRVVGMAQPTWVQFDKDYVQGQFDYEVEAGSTQTRNESFRQQHALQLVDAMSPFAGIVDPARLAQHVLRSFGIKDPAAYMMQQGGGPGGPGGGQGPPPGARPAGPPSAIMPPEGMPPEMMPPEGMPPEGMPPEGMPMGLPPELLQQLGAAAPMPQP